MSASLVKLESLKSEVQKGLDDIEAGRTQVLDRALVEKIEAAGRQRLAECAAKGQASSLGISPNNR